MFAWWMFKQKTDWPDMNFHIIWRKSVVSRVLKYPDWTPLYAATVCVDTSSFGLDMVLLQTRPTGERRPVAFASRSMTETEQRYSQTEKEALAMA